MSIKDLHCQNCGDATPHSIFSSLLVTVETCLICNKETIKELEDDRDYRQ